MILTVMALSIQWTLHTFSFRGGCNERYAQPTPSEFDTHLARATKNLIMRNSEFGAVRNRPIPQTNGVNYTDN